MAQSIGSAGATNGASVSGQATHGEHSSEHTGHRLGAFLCWAVVFADIGTSVYYVPGILYGQFHQLAGFFVILTLAAFVLLTLKYAEVSVRFPEGGGVVTVAARAINPWAGAVGGMFILVDYFLTSAISSLSGLQYFQNVAPAIGPVVLPATVVVVVALGVLNWWGIKESAVVSAAIAVAAFLSDLIIVALVFWYVPFGEILQVFRDMFNGPHLTGVTFLTGFAGAFLAFSGLESISQLSPVMRIPRRKTVKISLALVAITVGVTSPLLTLFSTILLDPAHRQYVVHPIAHPDPNQFISLLGGAYGGTALEVATAITASALLIFASNTAIIGAYHVFLALSRMGFFPKIVEARNQWRDTPHVAIILATGIPILVLLAVRGRIDTLGELYAFGLLGAFSLTCIGLDIVRYHERHGAPHIGALDDPETEALRAHAGQLTPATKNGAFASAVSPAATGAPATAAASDQWTWRRVWTGLDYYLGLLTTVLVVIAWGTNLINKPLATVFGGGLTLFGLGVAVVNFRYQAGMGTPVPLVVGRLARDPDSVLALLSPSREHNRSVIQSAIRSSRGRPVIFAYVAPPLLEQRTPELLEFNEPYLHDQRGRRALATAAAAAAAAGVTARFAYRVGTPAEVAQRLWNNLRSQEIIAEVSTAKQLSGGVRPEYVRYQLVDGVRVAHYLRHALTDQRDGQPTPTPAPTRPSDRGGVDGVADSDRWATTPVPPAPAAVTTDALPAANAGGVTADTAKATPTVGAGARLARYPRRLDTNLKLPSHYAGKANGARTNTGNNGSAVRLANDDFEGAQNGYAAGAESLTADNLTISEGTQPLNEAPHELATVGADDENDSPYPSNGNSAVGGSSQREAMTTNVPDEQRRSASPTKITKITKINKGVKGARTAGSGKAKPRR